MLKLTFYIPKWMFWDDIVNELTDKFYRVHKKVPNVLFVNNFTREAMNLFAEASKENVVDSDTGKPKGCGPHDVVDITGFRGNGYRLEIRTEDDLPSGVCRLAYDPALGDGLPEY